MQPRCEIVGYNRYCVDPLELLFGPNSPAIGTWKIICDFTRFVVPSYTPKIKILSTASHDSFLRHNRLAHILASLTNFAGWFLYGDEAFTAVNIGPDGVLNCGGDTNPLLDIGYVEFAPLFVTR